MKRLGALAALWLALATPAKAELYRWVDEAGRVHFSDRPHPNAERIRPERPPQVLSETAPSESRASFVIPFREQAGVIVVDGAINGVALSFIVDTGASGLVIPPEVADLAGIDWRSARRVPIKTAAGTVRAPLVRVRELRVGRFVRRNEIAVVQSIDGARTGLLGLGALRGYRIEVDRAQRLLRLQRQ